MVSVKSTVHPGLPSRGIVFFDQPRPPWGTVKVEGREGLRILSVHEYRRGESRWMKVEAVNVTAYPLNAFVTLCRAR